MGEMINNFPEPYTDLFQQVTDATKPGDLEFLADSADIIETCKEIEAVDQKCGELWTGLTNGTVMMDNGIETSVVYRLPKGHKDKYHEWRGSVHGMIAWMD